MTIRFLCDNCASTIEVGNTDTFTTLAPTYCPLCGTQSLRKIKPFTSWQDAACIVALKANPQLVQLLFVEWRSNPGGYDRFIDYARKLLT